MSKLCRRSLRLLLSNFLSNIVYPTLAVAAIKLDGEWAFAGVTLIELAAPEQLSSTRDGSVQARRLPGLQEDKKTDRLRDKKNVKKNKDMKSSLFAQRKRCAREDADMSALFLGRLLFPLQFVREQKSKIKQSKAVSE